nr:hypothetical protein [Sphingobium sp. CFD-1]
MAASLISTMYILPSQQQRRLLLLHDLHNPPDLGAREALDLDQPWRRACYVGARFAGTNRMNMSRRMVIHIDDDANPPWR